MLFEPNKVCFAKFWSRSEPLIYCKSRTIHCNCIKHSLTVLAHSQGPRCSITTRLFPFPSTHLLSLLPSSFSSSHTGNTRRRKKGGRRRIFFTQTIGDLLDEWWLALSKSQLWINSVVKSPLKAAGMVWQSCLGGSWCWLCICYVSLLTPGCGDAEILQAVDGEYRMSPMCLWSCFTRT